MTHLIHALTSAGDLTITWDPEQPDQVAEAQQAFEDLKAQGYQFFLVDGSTVEEITTGQGALKCRRVEPEAVEPKRRGRPRKTEEPTLAVATRPLRGG